MPDVDGQFLIRDGWILFADGLLFSRPADSSDLPPKAGGNCRPSGGRTPVSSRRRSVLRPSYLFEGIDCF